MEKSSTDGYIILFLGYARSSFRDFEGYLRIVIGLDESNIQLILKQYIEKNITYELLPRVYKFKDIAEVVYTVIDHERTLKIENDDVSMKTKFILTGFGGTFGT